ncbi:MAG: Ldh family oxidoreductase [Chloroflexota bacterium]
MISVEITTIQRTLIEICLLRGLSAQEADFITEDYLDAEMRGIRTHGLIKFLALDNQIKAREGKPKIIQDLPLMAMVDGQRELGPLAARYCIDLLLAKMQSAPSAVVGLKNASRYGSLAPYGRQIAAQGLIGLIINSAGPANVAPFGSYAPVLGTNAFCMAIPSTDPEPIIMDFATAESPWSKTILATMEGHDLPPHTYYRKDGTDAVAPQEANAVRAFGGAKGYGLGLAIQIMCGAFLGTPMGSAFESEYDLGVMFIAFNPSMFRSDPEGFYSEVSVLADEIRNAPPNTESDQVRLPGDRSNKAKESNQQAGILELDPRLWDVLYRMSTDPTARLAPAKESGTST